MDNAVYDRIIIGAGLYGIYAADKCGGKGERVLVLEYDDIPFLRATYVNQARVHMGYHYPRSLSTAMKSAGYYKRFNEDYHFAVNDRFEQIYATSNNFSWTDAVEFRAFCEATGIKCEEVIPEKYFNPGMCDGAFTTEEDTYDAIILRDYFLDRLKGMVTVDIHCGSRIEAIEKSGEVYEISYSCHGEKKKASSGFVLNATYASTNQIMDKVRNTADADDFSPFRIKYELCEIILCKASEELKGIGITVMDGPFFSIMPFGMTGLHSLTAVTFTPHVTSFGSEPCFSCQTGTDCSYEQLLNCNECSNRPKTAWLYMSHLADKYLRKEYSYSYEKSLFSMKPILRSSELDDSRPTAIKVNSVNPTFISVLSGKINTVYDLDDFLDSKGE